MTSHERILGPAALYRHDHPPIRSVNEEMEKSLTFGQRIADRVALAVGSWPFILAQSGMLFFWMAFNVYLALMEHTHPGYLKAWDPYPFILLNLVLSFQAAYTGPVVMMSQNRQSEKDRLTAQNDYEVDRKAEQEVEVILRHLVHLDDLLLKSVARIEEHQSTIIEALHKRLEQQEQTLVDLGAKLEALKEKA